MRFGRPSFSWKDPIQQPGFGGFHPPSSGANWEAGENERRERQQVDWAG
jgi:hypothetical protein